MSKLEDITFFPNNLQKNSLEMLTYSGDLKNSQKLFIEYSNTELKLGNNGIHKKELKKVDGKFSILLFLEDTDDFYFRFSDENSNIDDTLHISLSSVTPKNEIQGNIVFTNTDEKEITHVENVIAVQNNLALIPLKDRGLLNARSGLRFSYRLNKRIKLALLKLFRSLPSFITGNYRRRINL